MNDVVSVNNLQQWWKHTYQRIHLQQQQQQQQQFQLQHKTLQDVFDPYETEYHFYEPNSYGFDVGGAVANFGSNHAEVHGAGYANDYSDGIYGNFTLTNPYELDVLTGNVATGPDSDHAIPSLTLLIMAISYGLVVFGGVLGNATLVLTLCSASSVRLRNPLLLAVCIADLLVTGISAPVTLLNLAMNRDTKSLPLLVCKVIHYVRVMPVAASTISFFMLSLDRYATVKHPRLAQLRQRRYLHVSLAVLSWLASAAISAPFLFAYKIIAKSVKFKETQRSVALTTTTATITSTTAAIQNIVLATPVPPPPPRATYTPNVSISCSSELGDSTMFMSFIIFHTIAVFILPGIGVLLNHYGVRRKLCALSLTARAAHGELPLPMPILRRQTHMVIVTGIANAQQAACAGATTDDTSNCGGDIQLHNLNPTRHLTQPDGSGVVVATTTVSSGAAAVATVLRPGTYRSSNPISPRAMREIRAHSQRQRIINRGARGPAAPGIPLPQTSTLRSRRHLANMLIASALIFIACWAPHVFCIFYKNFGYKQYCSKTSIYFNLLLGYMYSAISPIIYWALNHNTLRQSPCAPIIRLRSMQNFLRTHFRSHTVPPPPSSTNEAALGAFNPKLIKLTPKQYRAQASSHYLY